MKIGVWIYTKKGCTLVDRDISDKLDHSKVFVQTRGEYRRAFYKDRDKILYLHRIVMDNPAGMVIDHIDRDALNNLRSNLRPCSRSLNNQNKRKSSRAKSFLKGVVLTGNKIFYEYTSNGKNVRSKQYYSQKMAHMDYCEIKKNQVGDYFYSEDMGKFALEEVVPKKAKPTKRNRTGYVGVIKVGQKFMISFNYDNNLIQEHGFITAEQAAKRYDELSFKVHGYFALLNFPENYKVFL